MYYKNNVKYIQHNNCNNICSNYITSKVIKLWQSTESEVERFWTSDLKWTARRRCFGAITFKFAAST